MLYSIALAFAAHDDACTLPFDAAGAPLPPFAEDARVRVHGCAVEADHTGEPSEQARDRLWSAYTEWLSVMGYVPVREEHRAPWNQARWQWFEHQGQFVELQVRRPDRADVWRVMLLPKAAGAPW